MRRAFCGRVDCADFHLSGARRRILRDFLCNRISRNHTPGRRDVIGLSRRQKATFSMRLRSDEPGRKSAFVRNAKGLRMLDQGHDGCYRSIATGGVAIQPLCSDCCKSRKLQVYELFAKTRNGKQSPIRTTSIALPKSPVSLT